MLVTIYLQLWQDYVNSYINSVLSTMLPISREISKQATNSYIVHSDYLLAVRAMEQHIVL